MDHHVHTTGMLTKRELASDTIALVVGCAVGIPVALTFIGISIAFYFHYQKSRKYNHEETTDHDEVTWKNTMANSVPYKDQTYDIKNLSSSTISTSAKKFLPKQEFETKQRSINSSGSKSSSIKINNSSMESLPRIHVDDKEPILPQVLVNDYDQKEDDKGVEDNNDAENDDYLIPLSPEEEENIMRLKSVYNVYFQRNSSVVPETIHFDMDAPDSNQDDNEATLQQSDASQLSFDNKEYSAPLDLENVPLSSNEATLSEIIYTPNTRVASSIYSPVIPNETDLPPLPEPLPTSRVQEEQVPSPQKITVDAKPDLNVDTTNPVALTSIIPQSQPQKSMLYSPESPNFKLQPQPQRRQQPQYFNQQQAFHVAPQHHQIHNRPNNVMRPPYPMQPTSIHNGSNNMMRPPYPMQKAPMNGPMTPMMSEQSLTPYQMGSQFQRPHPQTFENINHLPSPTELKSSESISQSLTSFRKQPLKQQAKLLNNKPNNIYGGTALNPMDHPDMFYNKNESSNSLPVPNNQYSNKLMKKRNKPSIPLPHHLRQSIVMTNPSELSRQMTFKPAGSLRTQTNLNVPRSNTISNNKMRVSGLLDDNDVVQPPSMGEILPVNANNDQLRKQLGSSNNYNIFL